MNLGNEFAQIKYCKTKDEMFDFIEDHSFIPTYLNIAYDRDYTTISFDGK